MLFDGWCLSFCPFSLGHYVVCHSIYGFWLSLWYLQTLLILETCTKTKNQFSVHHAFPEYRIRYPSGISFSDNFHFVIIYLPHLASNTLIAPSFGVYISQVIHHARACSLYSYFSKSHRILGTKLLIQGFSKNRLIVSFQNIFRKILTHFCQMWTDDERLYLKFDFGLKLINVSQ